MKTYLYHGLAVLLVAVTMPALFALNLGVYGNTTTSTSTNAAQGKAHLSADAKISATSYSSISHDDDDDEDTNGNAAQGVRAFAKVDAQARANTHARFMSGHQMFIDTWVDNLADNHDEDRLKGKLPKVIGRIDKMLDNQNFPEKFDSILMYLKMKLSILLDDIDIDDDDFDTDLPDDITSPTATIDSQLLVAEQFSVLHQTLSFDVVGEAMVVGNVTFETDVDDLDRWVDEIGLYDHDGDLIAVGTISDGEVTFDLDDLVLGTGSYDRHIGILLNPIGKGAVGATGMIMLDFDSFTAVGQDSDDDMDPTITTTFSTELTIASAAVASIMFVEHRNAYHVPEVLTEDEDVTLGLLKITAAAGTNTFMTNTSKVGIDLDDLTLTVDDTTVAGDVAADLMLQRVDKVSNTIAGTVGANGMVTFDLDALNGDYDLLKAGETAVFKVSADVELDAIGDNGETVQLMLGSTGSAGLVYHTTDNGSTLSVTQMIDASIESTVLSDYLAD